MDELVVSLLTYHQYPGGCTDAYCSQADGTYAHSVLGGFRPRRASPRRANQASSTPGSLATAQWMAQHQRLDTLACAGRGCCPICDLGWDPNLRNVWDTVTKGGAVCAGEQPGALSGDPNAAAYLDGSAAERFDVTRATTVLHRIRYERACRQQAPERCHLSDEELRTLTAAVIRIEMSRIRAVPWQTHGFDFDLRTREPMRVFMLLTDILWDEPPLSNMRRFWRLPGNRSTPSWCTSTSHTGRLQRQQLDAGAR